MAPTKEWNRSDLIPPVYSNKTLTTPLFLEEASRLDGLLADIDVAGIGKLMKISADLASETVRVLKARREGELPEKAAFLSYGGTSFKSMDPESLSGPALEYGQRRVRILSGRYGILRPLDGIVPYRLEMNTPLNVPWGGEVRLKAFWKERLAPVLREESVLINLASGEYSRAVDAKAVGLRMITLHFKEKTDTGGLRTVGMYAKQARGRMVRELMDRQIEEVEAIKAIGFEGYCFDGEASGADDWVFSR
ncbi:MAG: YaaA family protein [Spirochaetales bacterium]|nr:YaaA family protein [Spirochaetales bacterium]